jgi:hypothetical protein
MVSRNAGKERVCVDFRKLNNLLQDSRYSMPLIEDLIMSLRGANVFSTLDLRKGYNQVEISEDSRHLLGIITPGGIFEFTVLPFGVKTACWEFQERMENLFNNLLDYCVLVYIDDIIIYTADVDTHLIVLSQVMDILKRNKLCLNIEKCVFFKSEIEFLGFIISKDKISVSNERVEAIRLSARPQNVSELRGYLGTLNFLRRFIPNLANLTTVFGSLLKQGNRWNWSGEHEHAFMEIREVLRQPLENVQFDDDAPLILQTDASLGGIGGILLQGEDLVFAVSKNLKPEEQRYSAIERELLAVCYSVERLSKFLRGRKFIIRTDHKPLIGVLKNDNFSSERLSRLAVRLLDYVFDVEYVKGEDNFTDYLSRSTIEDLYLYSEFKEDAASGEILVWHKGEWWSYLRSCVRRSALLKAHTESHFGKTKMLEYLKVKRIHWPSIVKDVEDFLQSCVCLLKKENRKKKRNQKHFSEEDKKGLICLDTYQYGDRKYLTILDVEMNKSYVQRLEDKSKDEVQSLFEAFWSSMSEDFRNRIKIILTDNGGEFQFDEFYIPELKKMKTSVYHPQGNSFLERKHQEILKLCRIYGLFPEELPEHILNMPPIECNILGLRYIPKSRRTKQENVWTFIEDLGERNSKTSSIVAKDLESGRISFLHENDFKLVERPIVSNWQVNPKYLDILKEFDIEESDIANFSLPDFNCSWKNTRLFADLNCFYDLNEIFDKCKKDQASMLIFVIPDWKESVVYKRLDYIRSELLRFPMQDDLVVYGAGLPVGLLNFDIWIGCLTDFDFDYYKDLRDLSLSDWGGSVVEPELEPLESANDCEDSEEWDT